MAAGLGLLADQVSKAVVVATVSGHAPIRIIGDLLTIDESRNPGAAFSFAPAATVVFAVIAVVISIVIVRAARRLRSVLWAVALGLILAGALGNLIDRIARSPGFGRGAVVDFIDLKYFATFNVADSCITCGAALAVLLTLRGVPFADADAVDPEAGSDPRPTDATSTETG